MPMRERPTGYIRQITRSWMRSDGVEEQEKVLQMQFEVRDFYINAEGDHDIDYTYEWRDIPMFKNDPGLFSGGGIVRGWGYLHHPGTLVHCHIGGNSNGNNDPFLG